MDSLHRLHRGHGLRDIIANRLPVTSSITWNEGNIEWFVIWQYKRVHDTWHCLACWTNTDHQEQSAHMVDNVPRSRRFAHHDPASSQSLSAVDAVGFRRPPCLSTLCTQNHCHTTSTDWFTEETLKQYSQHWSLKARTKEQDQDQGLDLQRQGEDQGLNLQGQGRTKD